MSRNRINQFVADMDACLISGDSDPIRELIINHCGVRRKRIPASTALAKVDTQIDSIIELIRKGNLRRAKQYLHDLVKFNLETGDKSHLGMTICQLTKRLLEGNEYLFAARLQEYSMLLGLDDPVIFTARAELLKSRGKLPEALAAYDEAIERYGYDVIPRNGRADVLKKLGRNAEALAAYDETIALFPGNLFARNGRAGVLKKMGRYAEALAAYDETTAWFPDDAVARTGRAGVLKEMGRHSEALAACDETIKRFGDDVIGRNGRAEVLKDMGRLSEAWPLMTRLSNGSVTM
jgi:tetratricopeptide (TPR) repeat protein